MANHISFTIDENQNGYDNTLDAVVRTRRIRRKWCFLFRPWKLSMNNCPDCLLSTQRCINAVH